MGPFVALFGHGAMSEFESVMRSKADIGYRLKQEQLAMF